MAEVAGYELGEVIGRGTMGAVYAGRAVAGGREVAIKRVATLGSDEDHERIRREAETLSRLRHDHIVEVVELVDDGAGLALVMARASGGSLAGRLRQRGPMAATELVRLLAPVADALSYAHGAGVLHRDVKPSNILFDGSGTSERALLADFGIARTKGEASLTAASTALGTAGYLDPAVADGASPDAISDLYGLGVVCYEALTGHAPFTGSTPLAIVRAADVGVFTPLDRASIGAVAGVIERAMARLPAERFPSVAAFAGALRAAEGKPASTAVTQPAFPVAINTRARRRRAFVGAGVAAVAIAVGAGAWVARPSSGDGDASARYRPPVCDPARTAQCVKSTSRTLFGLRVNFAGETEDRVYAVGNGRDELRVANWFCGDAETLAVYRPDTGVVYYFDRWPTGQATEVVVVADPTGITGAQPHVGDRNGDGCADVGLNAGGRRTWFLPAAQPERLRAVAAAGSAPVLSRDG